MLFLFVLFSNSLRVKVNNETTYEGGTLNETIPSDVISLVESIQILQGYLSFSELESIAKGNYLPQLTTIITDKDVVIEKARLPESFTNKFEHMEFYGIFALHSNTFKGCTKLKKAIFPNVKYLGSNAFYNCQSLTHVHLPNLIKIDGSYAFYKCSSLETINLPSLIYTKNEYIFSGCSKLVNAYVPKLVSLPSTLFENTPELKNVDFSRVVLSYNVFGQTTNKIEEMNIPNLIHGSTNSFNGMSEVKKIIADKQIYIGTNCYRNCKIEQIIAPNAILIADNAFYNCKFEKVSLPSCRILHQENAFSYSKNLVEVDLPNLNSIFGESTFIGCTSLKTVNAPNLVEISETKTFSGCTSLESLSLPKLVITHDEFCFECSNLKNLNLPRLIALGEKSFSGNHLENVDMPNVVSTRNQCFYNNQYLISINLPRVTRIGSYFLSNCKSLTSVEFNNAVRMYGYAFSKSTITSISATSLIFLDESYQFSTCNELSSINFPSLVAIEGTNAFEMCEKLTDIKLENLISTGKYTFLDCTKLSSVHLENLAFCNDETFNGCSSLKSVSFPKLVEISQYMFYQCKVLASISMPKAIYANSNSLKGLSSVEIIDFPKITAAETHFLDNHASIKTITLPNLRSIVGERFFAGCTSLIELNLPSLRVYDARLCSECSSLKRAILPELREIGPYSFEKCNLLTMINADKATIINEYAFKDCISLKTVSFNEARYCRTGSFQNCSNLQQAILKKVTKASSYCFYQCTQLQTPDIPSLTTISSYTFMNCINLNELILDKIRVIYPYGFSQCSGLIKIEFTNCRAFLANSKTESNTFYKNSNLETVIFPKLTSIYGNSAFDECESLTEVQFSSLAYINGYTFKKCISLKEVILPKLAVSDYLDEFYESGVESISCPNLRWVDNQMFNQATFLKKISLPKLTVLNQNGFYSCSLLESISLPECVYIGLKSFGQCRKLKDVNLPVLKIADEGNYIFYDCDIVTISLPSLTQIYKQMFYSCNNLQIIKLGSAVFNYEYPVYKCPNVEQIFLDDLVYYIDSFMDTRNQITTFYAPKFRYASCNFMDILNNAKIEEISLNSLIQLNFSFPILSPITTLCLESLVQINVKYPFGIDSSLQTIELPNLVQINSQNIFDSENLHELHLPKMKIVSPNLFVNAPKLTFLHFPSYPPLTFDQNAFDTVNPDLIILVPQISDYINYDNSVAIPGDLKDDQKWCDLDLYGLMVGININSNSDKIYYGSSLKNAVGNSKVTELITDISVVKGKLETYDVSHMATDFPDLKTFEIKENVLMLTNILSFKGHQNIRKVTINSIEEFQDDAFQDCPNLYEIRSTSCKSVHGTTFDNSNNLYSIVLDQLLEIPANCFKGKSQLMEGVFPSVTKIYSNCFENCNEIILDLSLCEEIIGSSHFKGCVMLFLDLSSLKTIESTNSNIFEGVNILDLALPSSPPSLFHKDTFKDLLKDGEIELTLPSYEDYFTYDNNVEIENDQKNDMKWCGITLTKLNFDIIINNEDNHCTGPKFWSTVESSSISKDTIVSINVLRGIFAASDFQNMKEKLPNLKTFILSNECKLEDDTIPSYSFSGHLALESFQSDVGLILEENSFSGCSKLTSVILNTIEIIKNNAFLDCTLLTTLSTKIVKEIGTSSFKNCKQLKQISFPNLKTVAQSGFEDCNQINEIDLPNLEIIETAGLKGIAITTLDHSFIKQIDNNGLQNCKSLTKVELPNLVMLGSNAFTGDEQLETIILPNLESVPQFGFRDLQKLTTLEIPKVKKIDDSAFSGCISIINLQLNSAEELYGADHFKDCQKLETLSLINLQTVDSNNRDIFKNCQLLTKLYLGSIPPKTFHSDTFSYQSSNNLFQLILPTLKDYYTYDRNTNVEKDVANDGKWCGIVFKDIQISISYNEQSSIITNSIINGLMLANIKPLDIESITILSGVLYEFNYDVKNEINIYQNDISQIINLEENGIENDDAIDFSSFFPNLKIFKIGSEAEIASNHKSIPDSAFLGHPSLEILEIHSGTIIGEAAFRMCSSLLTFTITSITTLGNHAFRDCINLKNFSCDNCETFGTYCFSGCHNIKSITLPNAITLKDYAFSNMNQLNMFVCNSVTKAFPSTCFFNSVQLHEVEMRKIVGIPENAFINFEELENVNIESATTLNSNCFKNCISLTNINLDKVKTIGNSALQGCLSLSYLNCPMIEIIEEAGLRGCSSLVSINFPTLKESSKYSFADCFNLAKLILPKMAIQGDDLLLNSNNLIEVSFGFKTTPKNLFKDKTKLTTVELPNINTVAASAFENCQSLTRLDLPSLEKLTDDRQFANCISLTTIIFPKLTTVPKTSSEIFLNCLQLTSITLGNNPPKTFHKDTFNNRNSDHNITLKLPSKEAYYIYDNDESIEGDEAGDNKWCGIEFPILETVVLINNVHESTGTTLYESITHSEFPIESVESIVVIRGRLTKEDFIKNSNNIYNTYPNLKYFEIKSMVTVEEDLIPSKSFENHNNIETVVLESISEIGEYAFNNCENLQTLNIEKVNIIGRNSFSNCVNLHRISIPLVRTLSQNIFSNSGISEIRIDKVLTIEESAFENCLMLSSFQCQTCEQLSGNSIFKECQNLESISFPNLRMVDVTSANLFYNCNKLTKVSFGNHPPKVFNRQVFANSFSNKIKLNLPNDEAYYTYDNDIEIEGDVIGDSKWCGLSLYISIVCKINDLQEISSSSIRQCILNSQINDFNLVTKIEVISGVLKESDFDFISQNLQNLNHLELIDNDNVPSNCLTNNFKLKNVSLGWATSINSRAFSNLNELTEVRGDHISAIFSEAFINCPLLKNIHFPELINIYSSAFENCINLEKISFPKVLTINNKGFFGCLKLLEIDLPNVSTVKESAFSECTSINSVILPKIKIIEKQAFSKCSELRKISFPIIETIQQNCFEKCQKLSDINLPKLNTLESYVFLECSGLLTITLPKLIALSTGTFSKCSVLESIFIPEVTVIPNSCFSYCEKLIIDFSNFTRIGEFAFQQCNSLTVLDSSSITKLYTGSFKECGNLIRINLPNINTVPEEAFISCVKLEEVSLENVESLSKSCFSKCESLQRIEFNQILAIPESAFSYCIRLENISFERATSINRYSFANCISLEIINLTTVKSIGYNCFENCYKLRNIDFPSLENIGESCFKNCSSIEEIIFLRLQTLSSNVFEKCTSLVNVYLPQLLTLESEAFKDCQSLLSIEIESLTTINGNGQFKGCQQLKNVSFISLRTISDSNSDIFENCQSLNSIQLGSEIPKTFNKNTFINRNSAEVMTLLLPGYQSYLNYDASTFIEGDIANDQKWCSIELVQLLTKYRFNQNPSKMIYASNINEAISKVNIPVTEILQLEILEGYVDIEQMSNIKTQLTELEYLFISNEVFNISNKIPDNFFSGHQSIKEIHINTFLELGESSFGNCPSLETFTSSTITTITSNAFSESINLKTIEFNSLTEVSNDCFKDFVNLQEINLPKVETLYENCFFGCSKLETIDLPSLKSIKGKSQFSNCENLKKVVFKALQSIESTNSDIFDSCQSLEQIELSPTVPKIFHKDTFVNSQSKNRIQLILPTYDDYVRYDKDTSIDGDIPDDAKWCSLELRPLQVVVKINENKESVGGTLEGAITFSNVEPENILTIDIIEGKLDKKDFCLNNEQDKSLLIKYPNLKEFIIRDNIQLNYDIIPNNFFSNHKNLETIIIQPDCQIIFSDTFLNCEKIQKVSLNCTKIPTSLFKDLKSLAEVEINSVDEIPEELFYNCQKLQKVTATNATLIKKDAFYHCIALIEIEFESVQTIQIAQFSGLLELTTVHLNALISIPKDSFKDCVKLETLIIEKVENLEDSCFSNCKSLKILNCPNLEKISTNTVFENCVSLEEVNFDRLTNLPSNTFENLLYLKNVNIPQLKTTGSFTFRNCSSLENITFFELEEIGSEVFCKCTSLELVNLPSLSKMNERCFIGCISLVTISLPSLFVIPSESFKELPNLTTIQFEKATEIQESAFQNCYKLYDIHLPKVELIGDNAFMNCISIQDIVLNSLIKISDYIFSNCSHLQKIEINNLNSTGVNCFEHCTSLKEISIPKLITLEKETLFKCSDLESVNFPQVEIVKTRAFSNCISIKSIKLSELHTIEGEEIFQECISLGSSSFPKLTYANKDDPNLFENCKNMASIELPANPPKVFHHDVFKNQHSTDPIELLLPTFGDYWTYDNNNEIQGDEIGDCYWCGLYFPKLVTEVIVNQYNTNQKNINDNKLRLTKERKSVIGNSLSMAVWRSGCKQNTDLSFPTVSSIEIVGGKINSTDFVDKLDNNMAKYYPNLEYFIIESGVKLNESELPSYSFKDHSKVKLIELYEVVFLRTESLYSSSLETLVLHNVPKIHFSDFQGCLSLTTLTVDIVTEFESHLFINHSSIAEIIAPQLQTIGDQCFENSSIKTVQCPLLTSLGYAAFRNTYEFTKFTNLGTITIIPEECFYNSNIQEIDSTSIIHLKKGCFMNSNVHRVILPNLQSLSEAVFKNTNHLESIDPLTNIYTIPIECFYNSSLTQIELMNCNTIETKAFEKSHIEIVIGTKLEIIESYAFCNCQKLKEISFATVIKIGESTFELSNIKTVESETLIQIGKASFRSSCIQAFNCPNIENILESSFENCQFLETISELNNIHLIPLKCFYNCSIEIISSTSVEIIGESAFEKSDIQKIDFQTVKLIEKNGFKDCSYLQITNAPVLETIQGYSFYNCTNLNYILLPKVKTVGEYSFAYSNLQTFNKEDDTETLMINSFAFMNSSIESITVSSEITMGESIFKNCVELFKIQFDKIKEIASSMCANSLKLEEVIIPKCEIIGDYAFYGCIKLQKIDFTSIKVIKAYAFSSTSLVTITSTKIEYIGSHAFEFCLELTNVNLMSPSNNLIIGSSCFLECKKLKEAMIHGTKAMIEAEAFASSQLERIEISSLLEIESTAFKSCSLLLYVKFDNIVEIPSSLFRGLTKLAEVIIPKCEIIGNYSFFGCSSLEHINMQSIQIINWYAFGQTPLTTLSFTTIQFIGPYSFSNCTKLTTVEIVNSMPSLVISIDDYCFSFTSLKTITIICQSIIIKDSAFKNSTINEIAIDSELVLYPSVFENCIELNKVQLALIKEINASIFKNCVKLEDVVIPKCEIIGEYAFYGCILLKQIDFESIKVIESFAFSFTALVTINSYTIESLGSHAFEHCLELTTINLNSPTSNFVVGSYCFSECSKLQYITVNAKTIESYAFNQCSAISILEFPKLKILEGSGHFCQCKKLETIKLPLLEEVSRYNNDLFEGCSLMREIYLPPTPPKTFSNQAFSDISKENCRIVLNSLAEYVEYDDDTSINGDEFNDCYWCGFFFSDIYHSIIIYGNEYHGNSLEKAIQYSPFPSTRSVIINAGHLYSDELPFYQRTIESLIIFSEVVIHGTLPVDSFSQWSSLEEVELDVFTSLTYSIFQDSSIKIFKGKYLQEISADTFKDCSLSLESIELDVIQKLPNNAFQAFSRLETIILPNLQTIPHQAFKDCTSIQTIRFDNVVIIEGNEQFSGCSSLTNIYLPQLQTIDSSNEYIFAECYELIGIELPSTPPNTFHRNVFRSLSQEIELTTPNIRDLYLYDNSTDVEGDKKGDCRWCSLRLKPIEIEILINKEYTYFVNALSFIPNDITVTELSIVRGQIFQESFQFTINENNNDNGPMSVLFDSLESFEIQSETIFHSILPSKLFKNHSSIKNITLASTKGIGRSCFEYCIRLEDITVSLSDNNLNLLNTTTTGETRLLSTKILEGEETEFQICERAFYGCTKLKKVSIELIDKIESSAFENCISLNEIKHTNLKNIEDSAFKGCSSLISFDSTTLEILFDSAFKDCSSLQSVNIPYVSEMIGDSHFENCVSLSEIHLNSLAIVDYNSENIFQNCPNFESIELPFYPPKTFNDNLFINTGANLSEIELILENDESYYYYADSEGEYLGVKIYQEIIRQPGEPFDFSFFFLILTGVLLFLVIVTGIFFLILGIHKGWFKCSQNHDRHLNLISQNSDQLETNSESENSDEINQTSENIIL